MKTMMIVSSLAVLFWATPKVGAADLSGGGEWRSLRGQSIRGTWSASLVRTGDGLSGTFELEGSNVFSRGDAEGTISGEEVVLGIVAEGERVASFSGRISQGGKISGEWECDAIGDTGVWEGALRQGPEAGR